MDITIIILLCFLAAIHMAITWRTKEQLAQLRLDVHEMAALLAEQTPATRFLEDEDDVWEEDVEAMALYTPDGWQARKDGGI